MTPDDALDLSALSPAPDVAVEPVRRGPGRLPGLPRVEGSGRKKGVPNTVTRDLREIIITKGQPVEFLCNVVQGRRIRVGPLAGPEDARFVYPGLPERMKAAELLVNKLVANKTEATITADTTVTHHGTVRMEDSQAALIDQAMRLSALLGHPLTINGQVVDVPAHLVPPEPEADVAAVEIPDMTDPELARRIAYALHLGEQAAEAQIAALGLSGADEEPEPSDADGHPLPPAPEAPEAVPTLAAAAMPAPAENPLAAPPDSPEAVAIAEPASVLSQAEPFPRPRVVWDNGQPPDTTEMEK